MVDPRVGVAAKEEFFSLAAVKKWLENHGPQERVGEQRLLPPAEVEHVSIEERARRVDMLKDTAKKIREVVKAKVIGRPPMKQTHNPANLIAALDSLSDLGPS